MTARERMMWTRLGLTLADRETPLPVLREYAELQRDALEITLFQPVRRRIAADTSTGESK